MPKPKPINPSSEQIDGIGGSERVIGIAFARVCNRNSTDISIHTRFIVVTRISLNLPSSRLEVLIQGQINTDDLADAQFDIPGPINALLGAGIWARIVQSDLIHLQDGLIAQKTYLGWLIFGENVEEEATYYNPTPTLTSTKHSKDYGTTTKLKQLRKTRHQTRDGVKHTSAKSTIATTPVAT